MTKDEAPGVTIIRPLRGLDCNMYENLASSFRQDYPKFELIFSVAQTNDPAIAVVRDLISKFPRVDARLIIGKETRKQGRRPIIPFLTAPLLLSSTPHFALVLLSNSVCSSLNKQIMFVQLSNCRTNCGHFLAPARLCSLAKKKTQKEKREQLGDNTQHMYSSEEPSVEMGYYALYTAYYEQYRNGIKDKGGTRLVQCIDIGSEQLFLSFVRPCHFSQLSRFPQHCLDN